MSDRPRVVIVGAGFGGLWTAKALAGEDVEVLLVDRNNFHTFYPLLYQVGAAELEAAEIARPVRSILRKDDNVRFVMAEVTGLELDERRVRTDRGELSYDRLVLAPGSSAHFFGVPGAEAHAYPLRAMEDALALRNRVLSRFETATRLRGGARDRALRFVVVGGGPTGVEYAGALAELIGGPVASDFRELGRSEPTVLLLEATDRLLRGMPEPLGRYAVERLRDMGVKVRLGALVAEVRPDGVRLEDGTEIPAETVVWTAGFRGAPEAESWGLPTGGGGRVPVRETLQLEGHSDVYVVGDLADAARGPEAAPLPMVAPVAMQQGERAAANILRDFGGRAPVAFRYRDPGMLATIGRNKAVASIRGRSFRGFPAWLLWVVVHVARLIGFRNRLVVLINWAWDYLFFERAVRLILPYPPGGEAATDGGDSAAPAALVAASAAPPGERREPAHGEPAHDERREPATGRARPASTVGPPEERGGRRPGGEG